ncbi:MAG: ribose-phosphate pyrophosphokinase [Ruminococcus sp.]|nr:ribose-phosphate pyrophosphokinase [Ruminococcus sp.]
MILLEYRGKTFQPEIINYPDGTPKIDIPEMNIEDNSEINITWLYRGEEELFILACISENLRENYSNRISLYMPYLPNARMDRVHDRGEVFTLKYFCKIINFLEFSSVSVLDVHSSVGVALIDRARNISPEKYIKKALMLSETDSKKDYIFFADEGSFKRYSPLFKDFGHMGFGIKKRDWKSGKITGLDIHGDSPTGKNIFIVDDICSYGGTVWHSALKLKELGCKDISVYFTHCEKSIFSGKLLGEDLIMHIYTTNSTADFSHNKITVFDCTEGYL